MYVLSSVSKKVWVQLAGITHKIIIWNIKVKLSPCMPKKRHILCMCVDVLLNLWLICVLVGSFLVSPVRQNQKFWKSDSVIKQSLFLMFSSDVIFSPEGQATELLPDQAWRTGPKKFAGDSRCSSNCHHFPTCMGLEASQQHDLRLWPNTHWQWLEIRWRPSSWKDEGCSLNI